MCYNVNNITVYIKACLLGKSTSVAIQYLEVKFLAKRQ